MDLPQLAWEKKGYVVVKEQNVPASALTRECVFERCCYCHENPVHLLVI